MGPALGILIPEELRRYFRKPSPPPVIDAIEIICPPATNTPCACYVHYDNGDVWFYPDCSVDINAIPFQP